MGSLKIIFCIAGALLILLSTEQTHGFSFGRATINESKKPSKHDPVPTVTPAPTASPKPTAAPTVVPTATPVAGITPKYYLAPTGSDSGNGSISAPFKTLQKLWTVIQPGDYACVQDGVYAMEEQACLTGKSGTASQMIKVWACPGAHPVFMPGPNYGGYDSSRQCNNHSAGWRIGIVFEGNYVHFKGLEITGFLEHGTPMVMNPIFITNSSFNIFEQLNVHHNAGSMYIHGDINNNGGISQGNLILNSDFHHNYDTNTNGGNSDGMAAGYIRAGGQANVFRGNRSWWNGDDGFDTWANESAVVFENNWSWYNGYKPATFTQAGDGDGFKLGITNNASMSSLRVLKNNLSFKNREFGFDKNGAQCHMEFYNNTAYSNGSDGYQTNNPQGNIFKNNIAYQNQRNQVVLSSDRVSDHNSSGGINEKDNWTQNVTDDDFASLDLTGVDGARQADGSLPVLKFLHLKAGSDLIDAGVSVGAPFNGSAPDIGAFEY